MLGKKAEQYEPQNPYYNETVDERGKKTRTKRPLPEGLTPKEQQILTKVRRRAYRLDKVKNYNHRVLTRGRLRSKLFVPSFRAPTSHTGIHDLRISLRLDLLHCTYPHCTLAFRCTGCPLRSLRTSLATWSLSCLGICLSLDRRRSSMCQPVS